MTALVTGLCHPTQFMLDYRNIRDQETTLQEFVKKEQNYDLSFCEAWTIFEEYSKLKEPKNVDNFLAILDTIHDLAIIHLPFSQTYKNGHERFIQGKAESNFYWISKNALSDEQGIKDIIRKIWVNKEDFQLAVHLDNATDYYLIDKNKFSINIAKNAKKILVKNDGDSLATIPKIYEIVLPLYHKGNRPAGLPKTGRIALIQNTSPEIRNKKNREIASQYFEGIKAATSKLDKIKTIVTTARDLMHLHQYNDGNGRSVYIFANLLAQINNLELFYPTNMCIFDANSVTKMMQNVCEGQRRFREKFCCSASITEGLERYKSAILDLNDLIKSDAVNSKHLMNIFEKRDFVLLSTESQKDLILYPVFEFLYHHASILNLDLRQQIKQFRQIHSWIETGKIIFHVTPKADAKKKKLIKNAPSIVFGF